MKRNRLLQLALLLAAIGLPLLGASLLVPEVRSVAYHQARAFVRVVRPEPPAPITPIAWVAPEHLPVPAVPPTATAVPPTPTSPPTVVPTATASAVPAPTDQPTAPPPDQPTAPPPDQPTAPPTAPPTATPTALPTAPPLPTATPPPSPTPATVVVNGRVYSAYIPTANKAGQAYQYSCEFDAAWAILQTFGVAVSVDDLIGAMPHDRTVEPYIEETASGALIHGGDIRRAFAGDYTSNFLARSTGSAMQPVFERYGMNTWPVHDRVGVEAALRVGALVWIKTTVDFKPWRPATWVMPDGRTHQTVLGNDHAVVVIGFNAESVVIRDVLGPTSSNWQRPYEYEVAWPDFLAAWGAQSYDGLAVAPTGPGATSPAPLQQ